MSKLNQTHQTYRHKVALVFLAVGVIALIATYFFNDAKNLSALIKLIGPSIVGTSMLGVVYEYFLRSEIIMMNDISADKVIENFTISQNCEVMGLSGLGYDASEEDFDDLLLNQKNIVIVLNDGRTWISHRSAKLKRRFSNPKFKTKFVFVHPNSDFLSPLARKLGSTEDMLKTKISESCTILSDLASPKTTLEIWGHFLPTTQSFFICDDYAYAAPYPMATKMDHIPIYKYSASGSEPVFSGIVTDIEALLSDSQKLN